MLFELFRPRHLKAALLPAGAALLAASLLAGCGSSSAKSTTATTAATGTSGAPAASGDLSAKVVAELKADLAAGAATSTYTAPGPPLDASSLKGKTVFVLSDATNQFGQSFVQGVTAAAQAVGMKVKTGSGDSVITKDVQVLTNAVNEKVDAIILLAATPAPLSSALQKAKAAGIPVIESFIGDSRLPSAEEKAVGVVANATYCYSCTGILIAKYEILRTGGKVHGYVQELPGFPSSDDVVKGWKQTLEKYCASTCTTTYQNIPFSANLNQAMQTAAQVAAQDPKTNVLFPVYDFMLGMAKPTIEAAGAAGRINMDSENADLAQMQDLKAGTALKVNIGNPVAWDGWGAMDQTLRALLKMEPLVDEKVPVRMFTPDNINSIDLKADPGTWYGTADYASEYKKLWGVK